MTPTELCEKLGGYANMNKLIVTHNGKPEYLARMGKSGEYELTALGKTLAAEQNAKAAVGIDTAPKPRRKKKVSSEDTAPVSDTIGLSTTTPDSQSTDLPDAS